ncbi:DUF6203 family protein [Acrocarpospora corrugata]|uniref:DUF6203 family protein n=1 Tax=Acrocarpospora corrugata TaxID=35763 RepID=UPI00248409DE|nr:DUF6203 family protein [Acrocarpospora corrugata]
MKRIFQLFVTRWLSKTPFGLVILGVAWWVMRKRRGDQTPDQAPGRRPKEVRRRPVSRR